MKTKILVALATIVTFTTQAHADKINAHLSWNWAQDEWASIAHLMSQDAKVTETKTDYVIKAETESLTHYKDGEPAVDYLSGTESVILTVSKAKNDATRGGFDYDGVLELQYERKETKVINMDCQFRTWPKGPICVYFGGKAGQLTVSLGD